MIMCLGKQVKVNFNASYNKLYLCRTTRIRKNGRIDMVVHSRVVSDDVRDSSTLIKNEVNEELDEESSEASIRNASPYVPESKRLRLKRSAELNSRNVSNIPSDNDINDVKSQDVMNAIYTLVIFFIIFLFEVGSNK